MPDVGCYTLPDGECIAAICQLHGPTLDWWLKELSRRSGPGSCRITFPSAAGIMVQWALAR